MNHIHFVCGNTAAGKTTYAASLASSENAVKFIVDEWMKKLFLENAPENPDHSWYLSHIAKCEDMIWDTASSVLKAGLSVVMEISTSTYADRLKQYSKARNAGFTYILHYLDFSNETRWNRLQKRNLEKSEDFYMEVNQNMFDFMNTIFEAPKDEELLNAIIIKE